MYTLRDRWSRALMPVPQAATRLDARSVQAVNMLGLCYTSQGDLDRAIDIYKKALKLDPGLKDAWSNLATAHKEVCPFVDPGFLSSQHKQP